ncbi:hypothetical protein K3152_11580 [Qipengyuania sp. 1NDH17]|uniref:Uncharacterized protein n=2 Tax=Qipengyuania polymorpha TaxID=2867234 RepID=A0ABS7J617_9SPHN|nr:hypothetical protein [Qipengyuania polymorpha]MBX7458888.1 hypothetical protein [Qipengyuania polymorpha]
MDPQLLQFFGSLAAILLLAGIAWSLKLGPERKLESEEDARRAAGEAVDGFDAEKLSLDSEGRGALLSDASGNILLLRPHGTHFAGRILTAAASAAIEGDTLVIDTAEKRYGAARLVLDDAPAWVQRIEAIK